LPKEAERTSAPSFVDKACVCKSASRNGYCFDPGDQAVGRDYSFQEEEQTMYIAEGEYCERPSEDGEEDENNLFEEEDDHEGARVSPTLEGVIRHVDDPHSPGNQYNEVMQLWTFELLRTRGRKALDMVRDQFSGSSRQALSQRPPSNYVRSDLTDFRWSLIQSNKISGALLGQRRVLSEELKLLVVQVCEAADVPFEGGHTLNRSTKREFLNVLKNWDALGETFTTTAANQRTVSGRSLG
jgi:hypothetical protein